MHMDGRTVNLTADNIRCNTLAVNGPVTARVWPVAPGNYHVFPGAPNAANQYERIQAAVDAAAANGWGTSLAKRAVIYVHPVGGHVYTGEGPDNEINITTAVNLVGVQTNLQGNGVVVYATLNVSNPYPALPPSEIGTNAIVGSSNIVFIQPHPTRPCVSLSTGPLNQFVFYTFTSCMFASVYPAATASLTVASGPTIEMFYMDCQWAVNNAAFAIEARDGAWIVAWRCICTCNSFLLVTGFPSPIQDIYVDNCILYADNLILLSEDHPTDFIRFEVAPMISRIYRTVFQAIPKPGSTHRQRAVTIAPGVANMRLLVKNNSYELIPNAGGDSLLFDVPNDPSVAVEYDDETFRQGMVSAKSPGNYLQMPSVFP